MSIMGNVTGLGAVQPDWTQTDEKRADYIRNKPDLSGIETAQDTAASAKTLAEAALPKSGGKMTGAINMGSKKITSLAMPTNDSDAANTSYVDGKRIEGACTLTASGWTNGAQTVTSSRVYATDMPHWCAVYSSDTNTREAEKEAFALVDELETRDGAFVFRCFGDVPRVALTIQWEVNR